MTRPTLPPIPRRVESPCGPIAVVRPVTLANGGVKCDGLWQPRTRTISVRRGLSRQRSWQVFFHERTHAELEDGGISIPLKSEEAICDALANARLADLWRQVRRR